MRIGVAGAGHLGKIHLSCLSATSFEIVGFFDSDEAVRRAVEAETGHVAWDNLEDLLEQVDCLDIVSPTTTHYAIARQAIMKGKHVFVEKPVTETPAEAAELVRLSHEYGIVAQVGHVERYNPAMRALSDIPLRPKFIEAHRLAMFNPRGTDVSVVLDLMIHDLDIVLHLIKDEVSDVRANGVCIVSATPDICNARIEFTGGAVANLTASRISLKNMRKVRLFQEDAYISMDFLEKKAEIIRIANTPEGEDAPGMTISTPNGRKTITIDSPPIVAHNAIQDELTDFYQAVCGAAMVTVSIEDGYKALALAHQIQDSINRGV